MSNHVEINRVAIYGSRRQGECLTRIVRLLRNLHERGVAIVMHSKLYRYLRSEVPGCQPVERVAGDDEPLEADVAISLGGDGTFLRTARWVGASGIPIVGVNTGHLGYLAAYSIDDIDRMVDDLFTADYVIEHRTLLQVNDGSGTFSRSPYALNEIAVLKAEDASMIKCSVSINGGSPTVYQADGLIVSTPTGSTGYNLSVGGPIIEPTAAALVISPIAAHSLTMRPLVVSDENHLTITTTCRSHTFLVSVDGRSHRLQAGDTIEVRKAPFSTLLIQRRGHTFTDTLHNKLMWGI